MFKLWLKILAISAVIGAFCDFGLRLPDGGPLHSVFTVVGEILWVWFYYVIIPYYAYSYIKRFFTASVVSKQRQRPQLNEPGKPSIVRPSVSELHRRFAERDRLELERRLARLGYSGASSLPKEECQETYLGLA